MIRQLHITLYRLTRSKSTWILLFFPCFWGLFTVLTTYLSENLYMYAVTEKTDPRSFFIHGILISAVFIYLLIDREKESGGWRNKVSVGVKRHWIFLSSWLVSVVFSVIASSLEMLAVRLCIKLMGRTGTKLFKIPDTRSCVLILFWTAAFASLFVLVDTYFSIKFFTLVLTLSMFFVFILIGIVCKDKLEIPYKESVYDTESDEYTYQENPNYVTGDARKVLIYMRDRSPETAFYGSVTKHVFKIQREITVVFFAAGVVVGVPAFKRKELV